MARRRLSVQSLAVASEVPYGTLRRYLATERHIDVATLAAIADALEVEVEDVVRAAAARRGDFATAATVNLSLVDNPGTEYDGPEDLRDTEAVESWLDDDADAAEPAQQAARRPGRKGSLSNPPVDE